jgi:hypothetical protein
MNKFIITESEKERILNMHRNAIKRQYLGEQSVNTEPGTVIAQTREQSLIDGTKGDITYIGFSINGDEHKGKQYYYNCTASFDSTPAEQVETGKAGAIFDGNSNIKTVAELGMKGNYTQEFRTACANIYANLANKRKTFCADPKNKTKPNFAWNCPQPAATPSQVGSTQSVDTKKAEADAAQKAKDDSLTAKRSAENASEAKSTQEFTTKMGEYRTKLNGVDNMTQEQLESLINEINAYWKSSLLARSDSEAESTYRRVFPKFNTEFKTKFPAITVLLNTK